MSFNTCKGVWVFIERFQGQSESVDLELLGQGRKLADDLEQKLRAMIIAKGVDEVIEEAGEYGTDRIHVAKKDEYESYSADVYGNVFLGLCEEYDPNTILVGATVSGRDLGSKIAVSLCTGLTADCTALNADEESGNVIWERPASSGDLYAQILYSETRSQVRTYRPGAFKRPERIPGNRLEIIMKLTHTPENEIRAKVIDFIRACENNDIPLQGTEVIVSGGRGMKDGENFKVLKELADVLGRTVGCFRAAVDFDWVPQPKQVRQVGTTVTPKTYFTCAIPGTVRHVAGMSGSRTVVAVNKDDTAPISEVVDYGIVGDMFEIVPVLVKELETRQQG